MKTRAQILGIKPRAMERRALKKIARIDALLVNIAGIYGDIDESAVTSVDEFRTRVRDDLVSAVREATQFLSEEPESGDLI